jgi:CBS domain-containing protein
MATRVRDLMTTRLITVEPSYDLGIALALMYEYDIRRLPVVEDGEGEGGVHLVGIITDRDVRLAVDSPYLRQDPDEQDALEHLREIIVADAMSSKPVLIGPEATIAEAAQLMLNERVGGLPVVERDAQSRLRLMGIITRSDLLAHLITLETGTHSGDSTP